MKRRLANFLAVLIASIFLVGSASATTIVRVDLSGSSPDLGFTAGVFGTIDDGNAATFGDQDTNVIFEGLLDAIPDIGGAAASFSLNGIAVNGAPTVVGPLVTQAVSGGTFGLWDAGNTLLLGGSVGAGQLSGTIGGAATASFLTLEFGQITSGSLLGNLGLATDSAIAFSLTGVNGGAGFSVHNGVLENFTAEGTGNISAVPEPGSLALLLSGVLGCAGFRRKKA